MITNLTQSGKLSTLESVEYGRFEALFQNIMHVKPFLWQWRLFNRFLHNDLPDVIDIPTGLGKTSVMAIWLLARAFNPELPRRLIYVVDRKAVVDQATTIAEQLRQSLADNPSCSLIAEKLGIDSQNPIPISTLRGKLADNRAWLEDATCPAIIIGTIDMIGSRLLFSGYRTSKWMRPMQAALMTVDSLILLDEAHLSPTFVQVLSFVHSCRQMENLPFKLPSLHILPLSATAQTKDTHQSFRLDSEDVHDAPVAIRLAALKRLKFVNVKGGLAEELGNRAAIWDEKCKCVAVFCNGRADAQKAADTIRQKLGKGRINDVRLLTGARRGYERDCLAKHETFRAFQGKDPTDGRTRYLVCTSAGEVGVDLDAQHSVMDLVSLERMIQRLGRINRRGEMSGGSRVEVLVDDEKLNQHIDNMPDLVTVREVLMSLPKLDNDDHNASPQSVDNLLKNLSQELRQRVFTPAPPSPLLNFAHIEAWSLTSTDEHPGRPEIAPFVRGIVPDEVQTEIIWREDISLLTRLDSGKIEQAIESIPPNPSEILVEMTRSLTDKFVKRLEKWKEGNSHSAMPFSFLVVRGDHVVEIITIEKGLLFGRNGAQFSTIPKKLTSELIRLFSYSTLWLPYEFGGLDEDGLFSANTDNAVTEPPKNEFSALRLEVNLNTEAERPLGGAWPFDLDHEENWEKTLRGKRWRRIFKQYLPPENGQADSESVHALEYWVPPKPWGRTTWPDVSDARFTAAPSIKFRQGPMPENTMRDRNTRLRGRLAASRIAEKRKPFWSAIIWWISMVSITWKSAVSSHGLWSCMNWVFLPAKTPTVWICDLAMMMR